MLLLAIIGLASCSSNSDNSEQMTNYVTLAVNGGSEMTEDYTKGIDITLTLAYSLDKDATVNLTLSGDDKGAVKLSQNQVTFPAGQKTATVKVLSNNLNVLGAQEVVYIKIASCSENNMHPISNEGAAITVKPNAAVPELTAEQLKLIEGYKTNLGIDLTKVLGMVDVKTTITYGNDDKGAENNGNDTRTIDGQSIITLSENATSEKPVLKMVTNPMGMESFMYEKLLRCTTEDPDGYFSADPISAALTNIVSYNKSTETFTSSLDNITLNNDGTLNFTKATSNEDGSTITKVPFSYNYSVWTRLNEMAKAGKTVNISEGKNTVEYSIQDLINQYNTFNPSYYLGNSDISKDAYGAKLSNFTTPSAKYDFNKGTMSFNFSWDYGSGMILNDYIKINVNYTMHK